MKHKILVVDDNQTNQLVAKLMLEQLGYEYDSASDGSEALAKYDKGYHLILLDLGLPDIDGITVAEFIFKHHKNNPIPIIACTGFGNEKRAECLAVGMRDYLTKPIEFDHLKSILAQHLTPM